MCLRKEDRARAMKWYREGSERGDAGSQCKYASMLLEEGNISEAKEWYERAAIQGDRDAQYEYAELLYREGRGASDRREALDWYSKAAAQGNKSARARLKVLQWVPYFEDVKAAEEFFHRGNEYFKPKEQGHTFRDYKAGVSEYLKAANKGHARACSVLAMCYSTGIVVPKDLKKAHEWNEKARMQGDVLAEYFKEGCYNITPVSYAAYFIKFCKDIALDTISNEQTDEDEDNQMRIIKSACLCLANLFSGQRKTGQVYGVETATWIARVKSLMSDAPLLKVMRDAVGLLCRIPVRESAEMRQFFKIIKSDASDEDNFIICLKTRGDIALKLTPELVRDVRVVIQKKNVSLRPLSALELHEKLLDCCELYQRSSSGQAKRETKRAVKVHKRTDSALALGLAVAAVEADRKVERAPARTEVSLSASAPAKAAAPVKGASSPEVAGAGEDVATVDSKIKKDKLGRAGAPMPTRAPAKAAVMLAAAASPVEGVSIPGSQPSMLMLHEMGIIQKEEESSWQAFDTHCFSLLKNFTEGFKRLTIKRATLVKNNRNEKKRTDLLEVALKDVTAFTQHRQHAEQSHAQMTTEINIWKSEYVAIHTKFKLGGSDAAAVAAFERKRKQLQEKLEGLKGSLTEFKQAVEDLMTWSSTWYGKAIEITDEVDLDLVGQSKIQEKLNALETERSIFKAALTLLDNADPGKKAVCLMREAKVKTERDVATVSASAVGHSSGTTGAAAGAGAVQSDEVALSPEVDSAGSDESKSLSDALAAMAAASSPEREGSIARQERHRMRCKALKNQQLQAERCASQAQAVNKTELGESIPVIPYHRAPDVLLRGGKSLEAVGSKKLGAVAPSAVAQGAGAPAVGALASPLVLSKKANRPKGVGAMPALVGATPDQLGDKLKLRDLHKLVEGLSKMVSEGVAAGEAKGLSEHALINGQALVGVLSCVDAILEERVDRKNMQQVTEQLKVGLYQGVEAASPILSARALYGLILRWIEFVYEDDPNCDDAGVIQKTFSDYPFFAELLTKGPPPLSEVARLKARSDWETCGQCIQECHAQLLVCDLELNEPLPWLSEQRIKRRQDWLRLRIGTQLQLLTLGARSELDAVNALGAVENGIEGFNAVVYKRVGIYTKHLRGTECVASISGKPAARPRSARDQ